MWITLCSYRRNTRPQEHPNDLHHGVEPGAWVLLFSCSVVSDSATPWAVAHQAPLSLGHSRQEYWSGLPFPSWGYLPSPGVKFKSPALASGLFTVWATGAHMSSKWQEIASVIPHISIPSYIALRYIARLPSWLRWWRICLQCRKPRFNSWVGKTSWSRKWQPTPVFFPGKTHGQRSLADYSPWGCKELDTNEQLTHTQLSIGI